MEKFEVGKKYFIDNANCKIIFKVVEKRADQVLYGSLLVNDIKLELVNIETKYVGDMPWCLFSFLKNWFDFGAYNHLDFFMSKDDCEVININNDHDHDHIGYWTLWACDEVK